MSSLKALNIKNRLALSPNRDPLHTKEVLNKNGQKVKLADPEVTRGLVALMNMSAANQGAACHWGGPAAFAEIMSALHGLMFAEKGSQWFDHFHFINDAGHAENGIYALRANLGYDNMTFDDLWSFRGIKSKLTGHGESHINPEGVLISNGPLGSGLPQAQGLAMADAVLKNNRTTICAISDGALMEGEAKESLSAIPGLASKGKIAPFVMIVSYNKTKLSGRIADDAFSMDPTMESMKSLGWNVVRVAQGHDLQKVYTTLEQVLIDAPKNPKTPYCLIFDTIKGYGVKATEEAASGGHGYPLKKRDPKLPDFINEIFKGKAPAEFLKIAESLIKESTTTTTITTANKVASAEVKEKVQAGIARGLIKATEAGYPVYSVSADLQSSTGVSAFHKKFPDRFMEVGVAESNMISAAVGMSVAGLIPVVDTFAQFGVTKGNLPLSMAALSESPIIGVFSHTGMQDAADGASHQATTYLAATKAIPHTELINCCCSGEAESYMIEAIKRFASKREAGEIASNSLFFLGREDFPVHYKLTEQNNYEWGQAYVVYESSTGKKPQALIVTSGSTIVQAVEAAKQLEQEEGIAVMVVNNSFVTTPDTASIGKWLGQCEGRLLTIEDHQLIGGMGERLVHALIMDKVEIKNYKGLGLLGHFGRSAYSAKELYDLFHIGTDDIVKGIKSLVS